MKTLLSMVLSVTGIAMATSALATDRNWRTVCEASADKMFKSCLYEVNEEYLAVSAQCINQTGPDVPAKRP